ncbi:MAG: lipopolysaccharide heptosyltransferase II [candidate division Zixibacteria bacterium HGW-Zixibacteria-1]|nr:MAG: lipopolysaccharide heptosyltransferase II [candidate division Zixibacteria bacterium HGW-Zixibacteria-1]
MSKIIIRTPNHLGDSLMAQPAAAAFAAGRVSDDIYLLIPEWAEPIYRSIPDVLLILVENQYLHGLKAITYQSELLKKEDYGIGLLLTPSFSSALIFYLAGVKTKIGYKGDGRSLLLNDILDPKDVAGQHRSIRYQRLFEHYGNTRLTIEPPHLAVMNPAVEEAVNTLADAGVDLKRGFAAIAPRAVAPSRRWGSENYRALSGKIIGELNLDIVLVGAANEYAAGEEIAGNQTRVFNVCGKTNIETAGAVLSLAKLFIGNDSGLAHLAAAVDSPLVVLSGADDPAETSPISDKKTVIIRDQLECISCVKNFCSKKGDDYMRCMKEITVDEVFGAITARL